VIRVDLDPAVVVRDYAPALAVVGDAGAFAADLAARLDEAPDRLLAAETRAAAIRAALPAAASPLEAQHVAVLAAIRRGLPEDALVYADMTQIAYTGCIVFAVAPSGAWHFPMGFGTLGYALPAAIAGKVACPDRAVAAIVGDGGFQFTFAELGTAVEERLAIPIILWDNDGLAEIGDFMRARGIPETSVYPFNPDFRMLAAAYGIPWRAASTPADLTEAVEAALGGDRPTLIHVRQAEFDAG
jgi:5-guanidino-2-oxopentanoate decarboxylase